jgi:hypothetical protein
MKKYFQSFVTTLLCASVFLVSAVVNAKEDSTSVRFISNDWQQIFEDESRTFEVNRGDIKKQDTYLLVPMRKHKKTNADGYNISIFAINCERQAAPLVRTGWISEDGKQSNWLYDMGAPETWSKGEPLPSMRSPELNPLFELACNKKLVKRRSDTPKAIAAPAGVSDWISLGVDSGAMLELNKASLSRQDEFVIASVRTPSTVGGVNGFEIRKLAFNCATRRASVVQLGFATVDGALSLGGQPNSSATLRKYSDEIKSGSELMPALDMACTNVPAAQ